MPKTATLALRAAAGGRSSRVLSSAWAWLLLVGALPTGASAQQPGSAPVAPASGGQPATAPTAAQPILARVIEVVGNVEHSPIDQDAWQPCKVDDEYPQSTKIRSGIGSSIKFQIGNEEPYTCVLLEQAGLMYLAEAFKTDIDKTVRVGVGYGRVRAGVAERGGLKSKFTIDSPVATLSKRGTWGFSMFYERGTDRFEVGLTDRGLLDVINQVTGQSRGVAPGQAVTQAMRRWLDEAALRRNVAVADLLGQSDVEVAFNEIRSSGLGFLGLGEGSSVRFNLGNQSASNEFASMAEQAMPPPALAPPTTPSPFRNEGNFGTGRGDQLITIIITSDNPLAQNGWVTPGTYHFRRSAVETWLRNYRRP